ncbi:hypothetical protein KKP04_03635 [Rhodomicrobium sp. Az07]|uniref:hypothetical protein n=1 Tax=Rhodomicrobium sp. Az07 TaxID=2839034 RepID=UPI001BEBBED3|nr:hypothetical protein [Rhodomicrobium sp. Az07]MBT3069959.1 hypothetical protein [Rhodomicrobium sp. Az07]
MRTERSLIVDIEKRLVLPMDKKIELTPPPLRPKFATSMEKKIEHLWLDSEQRGWQFNEFAVVVLEVLTVLHHRNGFEDRSTETQEDREARTA